MKKFRTSLMLSLVLGLLVSCSGSHKTVLKSQSFTYTSNCGGDYKEKMYFSDDYFTGPSTVYNPSLATASMAMAMSAFSSPEGVSATDYSNRYHNNEDLMTSLGFVNYQTNEYYKQQPGTDSLGATYCYKELDDTTKLIAIGIRGQGYDMEWSSNFKLGSEEEYQGRHAGFYEASQIALSGLKNYIAQYNITGAIKIWVSGYSRAGATANLLSGTLDEGLRDHMTEIENVTYSKEDIYAYCFEPPMGAYLDKNVTAHSSDFNNIFNIVNRADPVPKVAMHGLGFTRYGIDKFVSEPLSDPEYQADIKKVVSVFDNLKAKKVHGHYMVDDFVVQGIGFNEKKLSLGASTYQIHWTQGQYLDRLIDHLTTYGVKTRDAYYEQFQEGLTSIFSVVYRQGAPKASFIDIGVQVVKSILKNSEADILVNDLMHQPSYFVTDLVPLIQEGLYTLGIEIEASTLEKGVLKLVEAFGLALASDLNLLFTCLSVDNIKSIGAAHYPDLCLAHMMARDPNYTSAPVSSDMSGEYYVFETSTEDEHANITVSYKDKVVASFADGFPAKVDSSISYGTLDGKMQVYIPKEGDYTITYDNCEPSVSLYHPSTYTYEEISPEIKQADDSKVISL